MPAAIDIGISRLPHELPIITSIVIGFFHLVLRLVHSFGDLFT